jgi:hypothetical protein
MNPQHATILEGSPAGPPDSEASTGAPAPRDEDWQQDDVSRRCPALLFAITAFHDWPCDTFKQGTLRDAKDRDT